MIRKSSVSRSFKDLSIPEKLVFGASVASGIQNNPLVFATPDVPVADLLTINGTLTSDAQAAGSGDHQKISAMHETEKIWETTYDSEADYVDRIANNVISIIELSNYEPTASETRPSANPDSPVIKNAEGNKIPGNIQVGVQRDDNAKHYLYIISSSNALPVLTNNQLLFANNPTVLAIISDSHRKINFYNLPSRTDVYLTIIAFNSVGASASTTPLSLRVP
jgi:hypothetical protein